MATIFSAGDICSEALRKVGDFARIDAGPNPQSLLIALGMFDLVMSEKAEIVTLPFLTPQPPVLIPLEANTQDYNVSAYLSSVWDADYSFVRSATLVWPATGQRKPLRVYRDDEWRRRSVNAQAGEPQGIFVERLDSPTLWLDRTPTVDDTFEVELIVQGLSRTTKPQLVSGRADLASGSVAHGLRVGWQMWGIYALARALSDGTIRKLPIADQDQLEKQADKKWAALIAYSDEAGQTDQTTAAFDYGQATYPPVPDANY